MSGAPGIRIGNVFLMAGVPHITAQMLDGLTGTLEGGLPLQSATIGCWVPESEIAELLSKTERAFDGCQIGSYPFFREGRVGANFVIRSTDTAQLEACAAALIAGLEATGRKRWQAAFDRTPRGRRGRAGGGVGGGMLPTLHRFEATLAAQDSATQALGEWCAARGIAQPATIRAMADRDARDAPSPPCARRWG
jgi:hypothetical protein